MVTQIKKRSGDIVDLIPTKITEAIFKAAASVGGTDNKLAKQLTAQVISELEKTYPEETPSVENVQDIVEETLIKSGHAHTAKAYILYRKKRSEERASRSSVLGGLVDEEIKHLDVNSIRVLKERYLRKDAKGDVIETPTQLFRRVANNVAQGDTLYNGNAQETEESFYDLMHKLYFLPSSPTLMNAGRKLQQLSACFVLPVEDNMEGIFNSIKHAAIIHKTGGGTGFAFSRLRPKGDFVGSTGGAA